MHKAERLINEKKAKFSEFYATYRSENEATEKAARKTVVKIVSNSEAPFARVISRLKSEDECIAKFVRKYFDNTNSQIDNEIIDRITDFIGVRIVCLYEDDIKRISECCKNAFDVKSITDKSELLRADLSGFGYQGLHLDVRLPPPLHDSVYAQVAKDASFEIQIRSVAQDAWSDLDHRLKYKKQLPATIQRRIFRLAALFELADQEFTALRKETETYISASRRKANILIEDAKTERLRVGELLGILHTIYPDDLFEPRSVEAFMEDVFIADENYTVNEMRAAIRNLYFTVRKYTEFARLPPPSTMIEIRHLLFLSNSDLFHNMLVPSQKSAFTSWLTNNRVGEALAISIAGALEDK